MTSWEFAQRMGVSYHTVIRWLRFGKVPGAEKVPGGRDWAVPEEALKMERPTPGPKVKAGDIVVRTKREAQQIIELRHELQVSNDLGRMRQNEIDGLQKIINDKNDAITELCDDIKSLQTEAKKAEDTIAYKDKEIDKVWEKVRELQAEIISLSDQAV